MDKPTDFVTDRFELPAAIPEGERNNTFYKYACSLWAQDFDESDIETELLRANAQQPHPLPDREIHQVVSHVVTDYPRGLSADYEAKRKERKAAATAGNPLDGVKRNDIALGQKFAEQYRDRLRYVPEAGGWFAWDAQAGHWLTKTQGGEGIANMLLKEFVTSLCKQAATIADDDERNTVMKATTKYNDARKRHALLRDCQGEFNTSIKEFDADLNLFNVQNGTIELSPFKFREHRAADLITKQAGCAYQEGKHSKLWADFLNDTFKGSPEVIPFIQRRLATALAGDTSLECFYIFYGEPRTGKSSLVEAVKHAFGDYATTADVATFREGNRAAGGTSSDIAELNGARLVDVPEPPDQMFLAVDFVKRITGGDMLTGRPLFGNQFNFTPHCVIVINTNFLPNVKDQTIFASDRCVIVPFANVRPVDKRDTDLKARLQSPDNLSAVLNWLLAGLNLNETMGNAQPPEVCKQEAAKYAGESNRLALFIEEECDTGEGCREDGTLLYSRYKDWCTECGYKPFARNRFFRALENRPGVTNAGRTTIGHKQVRNGFTGITLNKAR